MLLHWVIAVLVLSTIPIGWYGASSTPAPPSAAQVQRNPGAPPASPPPKSAAQQTATNLHKTIGICILFLTVLRVGWRLTHRPPALPESMARALRWLAKTSHALFYFLLIVMPLTGWWTSSAIPDPKRHPFGFGFFDIPFLPVPRGWASAMPAKFLHTGLALLMVGLAVLHILAALKHHFVDKDDVLKRMLPRRP